MTKDKLIEYIKEEREMAQYMYEQYDNAFMRDEKLVFGYKLQVATLDRILKKAEGR